MGSRRRANPTQSEAGQDTAPPKPKPKKRKRENPGLLIVGNPPLPEGAELMSDEVQYVEYVHVEDPGNVIRHHTFAKGVQLWALPDGSVMLRHVGHPRKRVWEEFHGGAE